MLSAALSRIPHQHAARRMAWRLFFGVVALNVLVAGTLYIGLQQRAKLLEDKATTSARNLARALQENLQGSVSKFDLALLTVGEEILRRDNPAGPPDAALNAYMLRMKARISEADSFRMADARGVLRYGIEPGSTEGTPNIADRDYFQQLRDQPGLGIVMTQPLLGRISKKWVVVFARRLSHPDGRFAGVVYAAVDVHYLTQTFGTLDVGKNGLVVLRNNALQVVVRYPPAPTPNIGKIVRLPALEALLNGGAREGIYRGLSPVDGVERIYAFSRPPSDGFNLSVGLAKRDYLAELDDDKRNILLACCIVLLLSYLTANSIYRAWLRKEEVQLARHVQAERMHAFANVSSDWFWEQGKDFRFTWFSEGMHAKSDFDPQALLGRTCWEVAHHGESELATIRDCLQRHQSVRDWRLPLRSSTGELHYFSLSGDPIFDQRGAFIGYLGSGKDVTATVHVEKHLRHMAHHDPLTGLPNRMLFDDRVERALLVAERTKSRLAIMFIDLDKFKLVNDVHGHTAGDALLVAMARRMSENVRASDTVARIGGDEFIVLLPEIDDAAGALQVGEKIREALGQPFDFNGVELRASCSIGIVIYPDHGASAEALARHADAAMYQAKLNGRNAVAIFDPAAATGAAASA